MKVLVTGVAGFIGMHVAKELLSRGDSVVGIDNINDYYSVQLKHARVKKLQDLHGDFTFEKMDLCDKEGISLLFKTHQFDKVVNLAAQAGVRYSIENPHAYIESNIVGFINILEASRSNEIQHLVYASSSSVYGANTKMPFSVNDPVDHPLSMYAATKKSNELMAHSYSSLFNLPTTGLRFFTVYGPWGRPDMALFKFTESILAGKPIDVFNFGKHKRDFTYIDDIVEGIVRVLDATALPNETWSGINPDPATSFAPWRVFNIGHSKPVELMQYIKAIEVKLGKQAKMNLLPLQPGDVPDTFADVSALERAVDYKPQTSIEVGVSHFLDWYLEYYDHKHD